jgi:hypothetical protein
MAYFATSTYLLQDKLIYLLLRKSHSYRSESMGLALAARKWLTLLPESGIDRMTFGIGIDKEDVLFTSGPKGTGGPDD